MSLNADESQRTLLAQPFHAPTYGFTANHAKHMGGALVINTCILIALIHF